jgi:hypothetical protein
MSDLVVIAFPTGPLAFEASLPMPNSMQSICSVRTDDGQLALPADHRAAHAIRDAADIAAAPAARCRN